MSTALENLIAAMSIEDLARTSGRSVTELVAFAMGDTKVKAKPKLAVAAPEAKTARKPSQKTKKAKGAAKGDSKARSKAPQEGEVDTRSAEGRAAYQEAVLGALTSEPMLAQDIRAKVGGTPAQCRAALNRLIYEDKAAFEGQARATTYTRI